MERRTQISDIKKYLETHKRGITSLDAIKMFGATRLSGIIWYLKNKEKMNIITEKKQVPNQYGGKSTVAVYKLV